MQIILSICRPQYAVGRYERNQHCHHQQLKQFLQTCMADVPERGKFNINEFSNRTIRRAFHNVYQILANLTKIRYSL